MKVEIWSDVVCPWCYIGKRRFESALARFDHRDQVDVTWRSFELNPGAPAEELGGLAERLASKYGMTLDQAKAANARVAAAAAGEGIEFRLDAARPGNTFDAHRLIHLANELGVQAQAKERLMAAYFSEGRRIGDPETLVELVAEVGIAPSEASEALEAGSYGPEVRADEREAAELGITGVPFFVLDRRYGVSGAQPPELMLQALQQAWREAHPITMVTPAMPAANDEPSCEDGSCAI
ncbi:MAG: disulfide bond formation protein DsbA [Candidatus Nephthysia bennettiae]|uniref:DsbA family oxidoreductase n=1 Tax=Candidatus Nephthysia bennettiae TaxID=3127016 RepID=A0A934N1A0_9BACT|nr:DsbA family oxidoreductase [Candidatus Dormibacteraeota bacterium]MBJ7614960.1 DsbA family oxidoreductase [Candidatus Dormibacteraeota bacterium]PZR99958.1 MAG: disulfide bond formation protein DsbA [Candidatus Dormibacteraeota bacterium]